MTRKGLFFHSRGNGNRMNYQALCLFVFPCIFVALSSAPSSHAHGSTPHAGAENDHLAVMRQVKEKIPEEYRIIDRTPVVPSEESLRRGREIYRTFCLVCHGEKGAGDGPAAKGMKTPPANFLDTKHSAMYGPGEKFWIVGNGIDAVQMPGFSRQIAPLDRWHVVNYILSLQTSGEKSRAYPKKH